LFPPRLGKNTRTCQTGSNQDHRRRARTPRNSLRTSHHCLPVKCQQANLDAEIRSAKLTAIRPALPGRNVGTKIETFLGIGSKAVSNGTNIRSGRYCQGASILAGQCQEPTQRQQLLPLSERANSVLLFADQQRSSRNPKQDGFR
jgi:hypothetical protein